MTREEVVASLKSWGVRKEFKPYRDPHTDTEAWLLLMKKPAHIVGGIMQGAEVWIGFKSKTFRVWTSQKTLARALAAEHGLEVRLLDGEATLTVPASLADVLLPRFGAKVKRQYSPQALEAMKVRLATCR